MLQSIEIPSSKSLMNRALILQSYFPSLRIVGNTKSEDVLYLQQSLARMSSERELNVGEGGTTLRFLALRVSRIPGKWILRGKESLFRRPHAGLVDIMNQLNIKNNWGKNFVEINSEGWKIPSEIYIDAKDSSQFATSLLLNSCNSDKDINFSMQKEQNSESYFDMSLNFFRQLGFQVIESSNVSNRRSFRILAGQKPVIKEIKIEIDLSSVFSMASLAALHKNLEIKNFPFESMQPDLEFLDLFQKMGILTEKIDKSLLIHQTKALAPLLANLKNCPDLFPVLACLCSQAQGVSRLTGTSQLVHKESDRLTKTKELLDLCGVPNRLLSDGLEISGFSNAFKNTQLNFDPASDHRMAMAAALMKSIGHNIKIFNPKVVDKSFPEFWQLSGLQP